MARSEAAPDALPGRVRLGDDHTVALADAPERTVADTFLCASGERWGGEWRGVPVAWLLERAPDSDGATHCRVHGAGGHVACVSLVDAIDGVLTVERVDGRMPVSSRPRFVAPGIVAARTVKAVERLEPVALAPGEDVEAYEDLATVD